MQTYIVHTRAVKSVYNGSGTVSFGAQDAWDMVPDDIKQWQDNNCTCRLCKTYVNDIGFVEVVDV